MTEAELREAAAKLGLVIARPNEDGPRRPKAPAGSTSRSRAYEHEVHVGKRWSDLARRGCGGWVRKV